MPTQLTELQAIAWTVEALTDDLNTVSVLKMPPSFQQILATVSNHDEIVPIASLHDMLAASSHSIIAFEPNIYKAKETYPDWLYATSDNSLDTSKLIKLFNKWLQAIGSTDRVKNSGEIHWDWNTYKLNDVNFSVQRLVLPNLVARWLLKNGFQLQFGNESFDLRLVPLVSRRYIAELITEPVLTEKSAYSYVMQFCLVVLPEISKPILLQKTSRRRWATRKVWIDNQRSKSLFLRRAAGYLDGAERDDVFTRVTVKNFGYPKIDYVGKQAEVFKLLPLGGSVPELSTFLDEPHVMQEIALMPLENRNARYHEIGTGLESGDHYEIFESLSRTFENFKAIPVLPRIGIGNNRAWYDEESKMRDNQAKQTALSRLPYPIKIEIHCEQQDHFNRLTTEILEQLDLKTKLLSKQNFVQVLDENGNLQLEIIRLQDQKLTDTLERKDGFKDRIRYISKRYTQTISPTGILIELPNYKEMKQAKVDPKQAIRTGMTQTGRISQFLVPEPANEEYATNYEHRYKSAISDLLRMLGYRHLPFYRPVSKRELPDKLDLLAFWVFQLNRGKKRKKTVYLPVAAHVPYGHHHMQIIIPSQSGRAESYSSVPASIQAINSWATDLKDEDQIIRFFHAVIEERESKNPTLLIITASKLRRYFKELKQVENNRLSLYEMLDEQAQLRVAILHFSADGDAPFCVPPVPYSKYPGLYGDSSTPHTFYSLHNVGNMYQFKYSSTLDNPRKSSHNPSTMMIHMCNLCHDDDPSEWAGLVHQLRLSHTHIDTATLLPQPIHDLEAVKKYIPDYDEEIFEDDINAVDEQED